MPSVLVPYSVHASCTNPLRDLERYEGGPLRSLLSGVPSLGDSRTSAQFRVLAGALFWTSTWLLCVDNSLALSLAARITDSTMYISLGAITRFTHSFQARFHICPHAQQDTTSDTGRWLYWLGARFFVCHASRTFFGSEHAACGESAPKCSPL